MVSAPFSYVGLVIALLLVVVISGIVWIVVKKLVLVPEKPVKKHHALPAKVAVTDDHEKEI